MSPVYGEPQYLGPIQWLVLGMALRDKDVLARVLAMDEKAFGLSPDGLARKLKRCLADKSVRGWLVHQGVSLKEGVKASECLVEVMERVSKRLEERKQ